jgi:hypothetical protein
MEPARGKVCGYMPAQKKKRQDLSKLSVAVVGVEVIRLGYNLCRGKGLGMNAHDVRNAVILH